MDGGKKVDFEKELQKFDFFEVDEDFIQSRNDVAITLDLFNSLQKRFGIEQNKICTQIEEIYSMLDESRERNKKEAVTRGKLEAAEDEKASLVKGFIAVLDTVEDMYRYSCRNDDYSRIKQMNLLWSVISKILLSIGVVRIEGENTIYDPGLNAVKEVRYCDGISDNIIVDVLKCGYIFKSMVLRKAEDVVNKSGRD